MKRKIGCIFYEYDIILWSSSHGGGRSRAKTGFYTENNCG